MCSRQQFSAVTNGFMKILSATLFLSDQMVLQMCFGLTKPWSQMSLWCKNQRLERVAGSGLAFCLVGKSGLVKQNARSGP